MDSHSELQHIECTYNIMSLSTKGRFEMLKKINLHSLDKKSFMKLKNMEFYHLEEKKLVSVFFSLLIPKNVAQFQKSKENAN